MRLIDYAFAVWRQAIATSIHKTGIWPPSRLYNVNGKHDVEALLFLPPVYI